VRDYVFFCDGSKKAAKIQSVLQVIEKMFMPSDDNDNNKNTGAEIAPSLSLQKKCMMDEMEGSEPKGRKRTEIQMFDLFKFVKNVVDNTKKGVDTAVKEYGGPLVGFYKNKKDSLEGLTNGDDVQL
jgi:hypothetical protein